MGIATSSVFGLSVRECVLLCVHAGIQLVSTISYKPMDEISPNFI